MFSWVFEHEDELIMASWILTALVSVAYAYVFLDDWLYRRRFRRQLRVGAVQQARYAVLDSWVKTGSMHGTQLAQKLEKSMLDDHRKVAKRNGLEYYTLYEKAERDAHAELMAALKKSNPEKADEKETA